MTDKRQGGDRILTPKGFFGRGGGLRRGSNAIAEGTKLMQEMPSRVITCRRQMFQSVLAKTSRKVSLLCWQQVIMDLEAEHLTPSTFLPSSGYDEISTKIIKINKNGENKMKISTKIIKKQILQEGV